MAKRKSSEIDCPACDSSILLDGDEVEGDEVFCGYCGAPFKLTKKDTDDGDDDYTVEPDW